MNPTPGQYVAIVFRNGYQLQGFVESWSADQSVLKSATGSATIIIQKTADDVLFYKISHAQEKYEEIKAKPRKDENDIKSLAELKVEMNEVEKEEIRERLNEHAAGEPQINYGIANINKIARTEQYTREETSREDFGIGQELQDLFSKKH